MATSLKTTSSFMMKPKIPHRNSVRIPIQKPIVLKKSFEAMAMASSLIAEPAVGISETFTKLKKEGTLRAEPAVGISETFTKLKKEGRVAFIPYITAGDPDLATTAEALKVLDSCGSDVIELGVPYSDPLADGPVIQASTKRALTKGTNLDAILSMLREVIPQLSCPVALFTYYNPILKRGVEKFMATVKDGGVHGLVVPDIPYEETEFLRREAAKNKLELVLLTTPTTPTERMISIVEAAEGFVYLVSTVGVTGARSSINPKVKSLLQEIKKYTTKPVAVGFGISKPEQVKQLARWGADGVIVGSAMVKVLGEAKSPEEGLKELKNLTISLKDALHEQYCVTQGL